MYFYPHWFLLCYLCIIIWSSFPLAVCPRALYSYFIIWLSFPFAVCPRAMYFYFIIIWPSFPFAVCPRAVYSYFIIWSSFPFSVCPRAVYSYDNSSNTCYRIVDHLFLNWTAAEDFCQKDGAHLISLRTENQTNFISEQLKINCTYIIHCPNVVYCMVWEVINICNTKKAPLSFILLRAKTWILKISLESNRE